MLDYESLKGDSSEQHFLSSVELWLFFFFFFSEQLMELAF